jgi:hypothetical protein
VQLDPGLVEQVADGAAGLGPEERERPGLGRDEDDAAPLGAPAGHERELVHGQRPRRRRRHHEGDAAGAQVGEVADDAADRGDGGRPAERHDRRVQLAGARADGQHERVEAQLAALLEHRGVAAGRQAAHAVADQVRARLARDVGQRQARRRWAAERLGHRVGLQREVVARRDEHELELPLAERRQAQQRLDAGDAAARDDHTPRLDPGPLGAHRPGQRSSARSR